MEDAILQTVKQVPSLAVLVFVVMRFLHHLQIINERQAVAAEKVATSLDRVTEALGKNPVIDPAVLSKAVEDGNRDMKHAMNNIASQFSIWHAEERGRKHALEELAKKGVQS